MSNPVVATLSMHSPAHRVARVGREVVEEVLLTVKGLPRRVDRTAIVAALERSIGSLNALENSALRDAHHLNHLQDAQAHVGSAADTIVGREQSDASMKMAKRLRSVGKTLDQVRDATIDAVVARQDEGAPVAARLQIPTAEPFAVSVGAPHLHALEREVMRTRVDIAPDELIYEDEDDVPEVADYDPDNADEGEFELEPLVNPDAETGDAEDDFFGPDDPAKALPLLVVGDSAPTLMAAGLRGELAQLERSVRTCLEDVGVMGNLRRLQDYERFDFGGLKRFESRMLASLDAAVALTEPFFSSNSPGARSSDMDLLDLAVQHGRDGAAADPHRAYARAFVLGSIAGEDTVRAALLALKQSAPYTFPAQSEAFVLAPNPAIGAALQGLCADDDPRLVVVALEVLTGRNEIDFGVVVPLLEHASDEVRLAAVRALGRAKHREAACAALGNIIETELDDDIYIGAAESLTALGSKRGLLALRDRLIDIVEDDEYAMRSDLLTRSMQMLGIAGIADDHMLLERVYFGDSGQAMALGFHGHVSLVDRLVDALDPKNGVLLGQREKREATMALSRITGAPLFRTTGDHIDPYELDLEHATWRTWWDENREHYAPDTRYRFGKPYNPHQTVAELKRDGTPVSIRNLCALELGVQLDTTPFPTHAFIATQHAELERARASVEAAVRGGLIREGRWPKLR